METTLVKPQPSKPCLQGTKNSDRRELIREWVVRFALNADKPLNAKEQAVYCSMWEEGFSDLDTGRLKGAFIACLRSQTFKTMPTIGDVRQHLSKAEVDANTLGAEKKWQEVLDYIRIFYSPDLGIDRKAPPIGEHTMTAIRAAGGIRWIHECDREQLVWCKKAFIESYLAWDRLEKGHFLLPEGPVKDAFGAIAELKSLENARPDQQKLRHLIAERAASQITAQKQQAPSNEEARS